MINWIEEIDKELYKKLSKLKTNFSDLDVIFEADFKHKFPAISVSLWEIRENYFSNYRLEDIIYKDNNIIKTKTRPLCYDIHYVFNIFSIHSDEYRKLLQEFIKEFGLGFVLKIQDEEFQFYSRKMFGEYQFNNDYDENGNMIFRKIFFYYVSTVPIEDNLIKEYSTIKELKLKNT